MSGSYVLCFKIVVAFLLASIHADIQTYAHMYALLMIIFHAFCCCLNIFEIKHNSTLIMCNNIGLSALRIMTAESKARKRYER